MCGIYKAAGHEVEVASLDAPERVLDFGFPATVHGLGPGRGVFGYTRRAVPWLKRNVGRFDLVIINSVWQYHALAGYRALAGGDVPYCVFTHGMMDPYFKRQYPLKHLKKLIYWLAFLRPIVNRATSLFFTSEEEKLLARESFPGYHPVETVVPYGSFGPNCEAGAAAEEFLASWPQLRGQRLAITLGRIHAKKGTDILIDSFAATLGKDPAWRLVIAGPDQTGWQKALEARASALGISDRVVWTGMLKGSMKWGAFFASEVFVLPSHQENFGIVVAEALSCSLPVLLSNKINIWREIERHEAGFVNPDTVAGTVAGLERWMGLSAEQRLAMRGAAQECFGAEFNYHEASRRLLEIFSGLARKPLLPTASALPTAQDEAIHS